MTTRIVAPDELWRAQREADAADRARADYLYTRELGDGRRLFLLRWRAHGLQLSVGPGDGFFDDTWIYDIEQLAEGWRAALGWDGQGEPEGWYRHPQSGRRRPDGDPAREFVQW